MKRMQFALALVAASVVAAVTVVPAVASERGPKRQVWKNVSLPFTTRIEVPEGTTLVRATATGGPSDTFSVSLRNAETRRRRCHTPAVESWNVELTGSSSCVGLAVVDPPNALWMLEVTGTGGAAAEVVVELSSEPVQGPAAHVNLSKLSMPTYELGPTQEVFIPSFDGTRLHAQLTRPKTDAKVPTVIVSSPYEYGTSVYYPEFVKDWGARGYTILVADVRGYNRSGGCVDVWGPNEQRDQKALVEWVAEQDWSNGKVGMYGASYVGTTPVEAAVQAPKALKAIITTAPVINAYDDWHFGGVPNGESVFSPVSYQVLTGSFPDTSIRDPMLALQHTTGGICDPTLIARANDPRAIYDSFYEERDFGKRAGAVRAAVLYTHGYEDYNVKNVVGVPFFNKLRGPRLGIFGHWTHNYPPRADTEALFIAWMDQYLKGKPMGLQRLPDALVMNNLGEQRGLSGWPVKADSVKSMQLDFDSLELVDAADAESEADLVAEPIGARAVREDGTVLRLTRRVTAPIEVAGAAAVDLKVSVAGAGNAYLAAYLYDRFRDTDSLISFGMANLAHRDGHDKYEPVAPGEAVEMRLPFLMTDHVFEKGHELVLEIDGVDAQEILGAVPSAPAVVTVKGGPDGTKLVLPTLRRSSARPAGRFVDWVVSRSR